MRFFFLSLLAFSLCTPALYAANEQPQEVDNSSAPISSEKTTTPDEGQTKRPLSQQFHVAIAAGLGFSNIYTNKKHEIMGKQPLLHYYVQGIVDFAPFRNERLYLESGLKFERKGYKSEQSNYKLDEKHKINLLNLQIPLYACYAIKIHKVSLNTELGPYFTIGLLAKDKVDITQTDPSDPTKHINTDDVIDLYEETSLSKKDVRKHRRFDCGLHIGADVLFLDHFRAGLGYDLGFINFIREDYYNEKRKSTNGAFSIHFGYYFF